MGLFIIQNGKSADIKTHHHQPMHLERMSWKPFSAHFCVDHHFFEPLDLSVCDAWDQAPVDPDLYCSKNRKVYIYKYIYCSGYLISLTESAYE
jgi:hypothetical protein